MVLHSRLSVSIRLHIHCMGTLLPLCIRVDANRRQGHFHSFMLHRRSYCQHRSFYAGKKSFEALISILLQSGLKTVYEPGVHIISMALGLANVLVAWQWLEVCELHDKSLIYTCSGN